MITTTTTPHCIFLGHHHHRRRRRRSGRCHRLPLIRIRKKMEKTEGAGEGSLFTSHHTCHKERSRNKFQRHLLKTNQGKMNENDDEMV